MDEEDADGDRGMEEPDGDGVEESQDEPDTEEVAAAKAKQAAFGAKAKEMVAAAHRLLFLRQTHEKKMMYGSQFGTLTQHLGSGSKFCHQVAPCIKLMEVTQGGRLQSKNISQLKVKLQKLLGFKKTLVPELAARWRFSVEFYHQKAQ